MLSSARHCYFARSGTLACSMGSKGFHGCRAVRQMQELLNWCRMKGFPLDHLRKVLNMPRPAWNVITITVENARPNDCFLRVWYSGPACEKGLLFACNGGVVSGNEPKGTQFSLGIPGFLGFFLDVLLGALRPFVSTYSLTFL
jgi:hypothetical protein